MRLLIISSICLLFSLPTYGEETKADLPIKQLVQQLYDQDKTVREKASDQLVKRGKAAVAPLVKVFLSRKQPGHKLAYQALIKIGPPAYPAMARILATKRMPISRMAFVGLEKMFEKHPKLMVSALKHPHKDVKIAAFSTIYDHKNPPSYLVTPLVKCLYHKSSYIARYSVNVLTKMGPSIIAQLYKSLSVYHLKTRGFWDLVNHNRALRYTLQVIQKNGKKGVPYLVKGLGHKDDNVKLYAAVHLTGGPHATQALETINNVFVTTSNLRNNPQVHVIDHLEKLGAKAVPTIPGLIVRLQDKSSVVRRFAIFALIKMDKPALEALNKRMAHPDPKVRLSVIKGAHTLAYVRAKGAEKMLPIILPGFKERDVKIRGLVISTCECLEKKATPAVPQLIQALEDPHPQLRAVAAMALGNIGSKAQKAIPALQKMLRHRDKIVRAGAVIALGNMGPKAKVALADLKKLLKDRDKFVRQDAAKAIAKLEGGKKKK